MFTLWHTGLLGGRIAVHLGVSGHYKIYENCLHGFHLQQTLFSWKKSCFALRTSSVLAGHLIRSFLRAQRALMTPHTTRQVDVDTPTSLCTTLKNAPDTSRWSAKTTCRSAGTGREWRMGRSRRGERRRAIYITTSRPKRRYKYVSSSVHAKSGFLRSLRGLSTRTLRRRRRRNILFASILASQWSWVTLLLT